MSEPRSTYEPALAKAVAHSHDWLDSLGTRRVSPSASADEMVERFGGELQELGRDPGEVVDELATTAEPGLMAIGSGRFYGWVMGGTLPAALAADWLVSAWDQNNGIRFATPATAALEEVAGSWLLDLFGFPPSCDVGFVTGCTMANFTGLAAARFHVLDQVGWDVNSLGLAGSPRVHVVVGAQRHDTIDLALRYLGLGAPRPVATDDEGRLRVEALEAALKEIPDGEPIIVCLQAGNLHSGAFDPFAEAIDLAHRRRAWVHVDGAFGLWAAATPSLAHLVAGLAHADSWATDAHKTLNVPYDCGIAIVAHPRALRATFGTHTEYLIRDGSAVGDPYEKVPEFSRRARGVPVWAALRSLGRSGVAELVDGLVLNAKKIAAGVHAIEGARVLNEVDYTQVCIAFEDDERTRLVTRRIIDEGACWMSGSRWKDVDVLRVSVSNWSTDDEDVRLSLAALARAAAPGDQSPR